MKKTTLDVTWKLVECVESDGKTWSFTPGRKYNVHVDGGYFNDYHVYDDTGLALYLLQNGDDVTGAGVPGFLFKGVK